MIARNAHNAKLALLLVLLGACGGSAAAPADSVAPAPTVVTIEPSTSVTEATTTSTEAPVETTIPPLRSVESQPAGVCDSAGETPCIEIESFTVDGDTLVVEWDALGFEPSNGANHAHFYWNTFLSSQVGTNASSFGVSQGSWELTDQRPWRSTSLSLSTAPEAATGLCVTAANGNHGVVDPAFFECVPVAELAGDLTMGFVEVERVYLPVVSVCMENDGERQMAVATTEGPSPWTVAVGFDGTDQVIRVEGGTVDGPLTSSWVSSGLVGDERLAGAPAGGGDAGLPIITFDIDRGNASPCGA